MTIPIKTFYFTTKIVFAHLELVFEMYEELEVCTPDISVFGVQTSISLPNFAWILGDCLSLRFRYDILREKFIGFNDLIQYRKWNLLGYAIHEQFETYIAFPEITEPNRLIAITRNYDKNTENYFLPQYTEQDFFIFAYSPLLELSLRIENIQTDAVITPLNV